LRGCSLVHPQRNAGANDSKGRGKGVRQQILRKWQGVEEQGCDEDMDDERRRGKAS
jgi:hypothetical protein